MVTTVLDQILSKITRKKAAAVEDFFALARQIAEGRTPAADDVFAAMTEAGKSAEDLRKLVETIGQRFEASRGLKKIAEGEKGRAEIERQVAGHKATFEEAERKYDEATAPLFNRLQIIQEASAQRNQLIGVLNRTCPYPAVMKKHHDLFSRIQFLSQRRLELNEGIQGEESQIRHYGLICGALRMKPGAPPIRDMVTEERVGEEQAKHRHKMHQERKAKLVEELAGVEKELAAIEPEYKKAEAAILDP